MSQSKPTTHTINKAEQFLSGLIVPEVVNISYNTGTCALPDIYTLAAFGHCAYISGKALLPVL